MSLGRGRPSMKYGLSTDRSHWASYALICREIAIAEIGRTPIRRQLESILHGELNDSSTVGDRADRLTEHGAVDARRRLRPIHPVEHVERLGPDLDVPRVSEPEVSRQRHVHV